MYKQFLVDLWETKGDGYILLWAYDGDRLKESFWFKTADAAAAFLDKYADRRVNFYVGVGLSPKDYGRHQRCLKKDIVGIAGLFLDLDIRAPEHRKTNLPESHDEAMQLLNAIPQEPTYIINSGHGMQAWWLFKEVWMFDSPTERADAEQLEKRLVYYLKQKPRSAGGTLTACSIWTASCEYQGPPITRGGQYRSRCCAGPTHDITRPISSFSQSWRTTQQQAT